MVGIWTLMCGGRVSKSSGILGPIGGRRREVVAEGPSGVQMRREKHWFLRGFIPNICTPVLFFHSCVSFLVRICREKLRFFRSSLQTKVHINGRRRVFFEKFALPAARICTLRVPLARRCACLPEENRENWSGVGNL